MSFHRFVLALFASLLLAAAVRPAWSAGDPSIVTAIREISGPDGFGLDIDVEGAAKPRLILLRNPYRVALDFDHTLAAAKLPPVPDGPLVKDLRHGLIGADRYRLILTLARAVRPELSVVPRGDASRVSLHLEPAADDAFVAAPVRSAPTPVQAKGGARSPFVVVLDPGHGGIDRGATGENGTEEKAVNLAFGMALRDALARYPGVKVLMTREDDTFIPLNERAAIARRANANLMVSLHADSIRYKDLRGATVYTLSEKASDSLSRELADVENSADRFAGPEWDQDAPEIHDILVDLVRRETEGLSEHFAVRLVADLRDGEIRLINNPKRSAGFRVLRAPDVPSILLEMGYLSNPEDERELKSAEWQKRLAEILARSIADFAGRAPVSAKP
ncbi:N-acetylmuramoyl-L-alanine amidase [Aureimonas flava]|uniref:N-acetylmuramoyl-L-alanine amidase n=1 Tax=Aureimonas flava TaxID=2320271 RepID=A0A3A1WQR4_9HYPH|nr:N-acetylmuramoyl-L-alanine amidase [Aureimonas flava]RIY03730.1 N-acetylmuramoyl-L-alanine amidase [Aureimonas flava]